MKHLPEGLLGWSQRLSSAKKRISYKHSQRKICNETKRRRKERGRIFQLGTSFVFWLVLIISIAPAVPLCCYWPESPLCIFTVFDWNLRIMEGDQSGFSPAARHCRAAQSSWERLPGLHRGMVQVRAARVSQGHRQNLQSFLPAVTERQITWSIAHPFQTTGIFLTSRQSHHGSVPCCVSPTEGSRMSHPLGSRQKGSSAPAQAWMLQHYGKGQGDASFQGSDTNSLKFCSFPNVLSLRDEKTHHQPPFFVRVVLHTLLRNKSMRA